MTIERQNAARKRHYLDPRRILTVPGAHRQAVREIAARAPRRLSDHQLRQLAIEVLQAAAFSWGIGELWTRSVLFSPQEEDGHDCILAGGRSAGGHRPCFVPLQLKTYTPFSGSLQELIDGLEGKYHDSEELYVAINVNKPGVIHFPDLTVPPGLRSQIHALWVFGRTSDDRTKWCFYGDLVGKAQSAPGELLAEPRSSIHVIPDIISLG